MEILFNEDNDVSATDIDGDTIILEMTQRHCTNNTEVYLVLLYGVLTFFKN